MPNKQIPTDHEVSERAFHIWLDEGKPDGMAEAHWHRAKEMLAARDAFSEAPAPEKPKAVRAKKAPAKAEAAAPVEAAPTVPKGAAKPRKPKA